MTTQMNTQSRGLS